MSKFVNNSPQIDMLGKNVIVQIFQRVEGEDGEQHLDAEGMLKTTGMLIGFQSFKNDVALVFKGFPEPVLYDKEECFVEFYDANEVYLSSRKKHAL